MEFQVEFHGARGNIRYPRGQGENHEQVVPGDEPGWVGDVGEVRPCPNSCCIPLFSPQEAAEIYPRPYASVWRSLYCFHGYAIHRRVRDSLASSNAL